MASVGGVAGRVPATPHADPIGKPPAPRRVADFLRRNEEPAWRGTAWIAVLLPLAALAFAVSVLAVKAWPAIRVNGWYFLYGRTWTVRDRRYGATVHTDGVAHLQGAKFGAWAIIWGTLVSSLIAIVIAVPLSIGAAFALTERMPTWISRPLGFTIEILAGIPSVVIGLWGILTFGPWLAKNVYPVIADNMPDVPVLRYFRQPGRRRRGPPRGGHRARPDDRPHHRLDHPRPLPAGAPAPQGRGVSARHDRLGGGATRSRCPGCARASSAPPCSASAGPWARPSPSP